MSEQLKEKDLSKVVGGDNNNSLENIKPGDRFKNVIYVFEVIRLYSTDKNHDFDEFECKFWDSYGNYLLGKQCTKIDTYARVKLLSYERF